MFRPVRSGIEGDRANSAPDRPTGALVGGWHGADYTRADRRLSSHVRRPGSGKDRVRRGNLPLAQWRFQGLSTPDEGLRSALGDREGPACAWRACRTDRRRDPSVLHPVRVCRGFDGRLAISERGVFVHPHGTLAWREEAASGRRSGAAESSGGRSRTGLAQRAVVPAGLEHAARSRAAQSVRPVLRAC